MIAREQKEKYGHLVEVKEEVEVEVKISFLSSLLRVSSCIKEFFKGATPIKITGYMLLNLKQCILNQVSFNQNFLFLLLIFAIDFI